MNSSVPPKDPPIDVVDYRRDIDELTGFEILADFEKFRHRNDIFCRALWDENVTSQKVMDFYLGYFMPRAKARKSDGFSQRDQWISGLELTYMF